jgi:hypothetical protein
MRSKPRRSYFLKEWEMPNTRHQPLARRGGASRLHAIVGSDLRQKADQFCCSFFRPLFGQKMPAG